MKEMYFTMAGCNHYYGSDFMEKGMKVKLVKEPDNEYDSEAIQVKIKGLGKVGYVANSPYTVKGESMSAGRLYDKIGGKAKGKIVFVTDGGVICKVISDGTEITKAIAAILPYYDHVLGIEKIEYYPKDTIFLQNQGDSLR